MAIDQHPMNTTQVARGLLALVATVYLAAPAAWAQDSPPDPAPTMQQWHPFALQALRDTAAQRHYAPARIAMADAGYVARLVQALDPQATVLDDAARTQLTRTLGARAPGDSQAWAQQGFAAYAGYHAQVLRWLRSDQLARLIDQASTSVHLPPASDSYNAETAQALPAAATSALTQRRLLVLRGEAQQLARRGIRAEQVGALLRERYRQLAERQRQTRARDVLSTLANAWVSALDPHSEYYPPRERRPREKTRAPLQGIGVQLKYDGKFIAVRRVFAGSAAERSGMLTRGDRILALAEGEAPFVDVVGWPLKPVVQRMRGAPGTTIRLLAQPAQGTPQIPPRVVFIERDTISLERQRLTERLVLQDGQRIGILQVPAFYVDYAALGRGDPRATAVSRDARAALRRLAEQDIAALLVDLRGNSGGALTEAVALSGMFIDQGPVVRVQHGDGRIETFDDNAPGTVYDGPLMILVDCASASASEIFAGAMQEHARATIVGERTYGKGSVQETQPLELPGQPHADLGRFRHTMAMYFLPSGRSTQRDAVVPDIALGNAWQSCHLTERDIPQALATQRIAPAPIHGVHSKGPRALLPSVPQIAKAFGSTKGDPTAGDLRERQRAHTLRQAVALLARMAQDIT